MATAKKKKAPKGGRSKASASQVWIVWGWHTGAYALMVLQICLAAMNIRGERRNAGS
jgi:hypothetical protein